MKTYKGLYEYMLNRENIRKAIIIAARDKHKRRSVKMVFSDLENYIDKTEDIMTSFSYEPRIYEKRQIVEGSKHKIRTIQKQPFFPDQIIQSSMVEAITPMMEKSLYEYAHGSLKNRGTDQSKAVIERWIREDPKGTRCCCQLDIHHCYPSVDQEVLKHVFHEKVHDRRFNKLNDKIIHTLPFGLPTGAKSSFIYLHILLTPLDHLIANDPSAKHYLRHADDMIIFGSSKRELHKLRARIEMYLKTVLNMQINPKWQIFPLPYEGRDGKKHGHPLDTCGYLFYRDRTTLRLEKMLSITRKAAKISKKERPTRYDAQQMLSKLGQLRHADVYNVYEDYVKPKVRKKQLRKIVSKYQRSHNDYVEKA